MYKCIIMYKYSACQWRTLGGGGGVNPPPPPPPTLPNHKTSVQISFKILKKIAPINRPTVMYKCPMQPGMEPDIEVHWVELTWFQYHCQKNRAEIETINCRSCTFSNGIWKNLSTYEQMLSLISHGQIFRTCARS